MADTKAELVVALDFDDTLDALNMATSLREYATWVKVGLELFITEGPRVVQTLHGMGFKVFLDLKLHDIPNTVYGAVRAASRAGADMLTVHVAGGRAMCQEAVRASHDAAQETGRPPEERTKIFGVTVLTSLADGELPGVSVPLSQHALSLAQLAAEWGLDGVVCSGHEAAAIKEGAPGLQCLTPGIRLPGNTADDQRRVMTPAQAVQAGADYLVVGRPITRASKPEEAAAQIRRNMEQV